MLHTMRRLKQKKEAMKTVTGKTVLVTGAAMGLGKLFAQKAVGENAAAVVLWDINEGALKDTAAELDEAGGGTVHTYVVDVSSAEAVAAAAVQVREDAGAVEILFNNAGIVRGNGYFWETSSVRDIERRWRSTPWRRCSSSASSCPA